MNRHERLRRHLAYCRRVALRMQRDGTWPWPEREVRVSIQSRPSQRDGPRELKVPGRPACAKIQAGPVPIFDNSSSEPARAAELLTVAQAAAFLTISKSSVRRLQQARQLPFVRVGRAVRFLQNDLASYLQRRRVRPLDP